MSKYAKFATFILLFLIVSAGLSYKLTSSFNFHPDFARDIYDMLAIIQGNPTLIGPKLSLGGIYSGPYYYYLRVVFKKSLEWSYISSLFAGFSHASLL